MPDAPPTHPTDPNRPAQPTALPTERASPTARAASPACEDDNVNAGALTSAQRMLLDFLREHDAACPVCGYNVRALTRPVCPECRHDLALTVGAVRPRLGWLLIALVPGFFSGITACFILIMIIARLTFGDGQWSLTLTSLDLFGLTSGAFAIILGIQRLRFMALPPAQQRLWAIIIWLIHIGAFVLLITIGRYYL